MSSETPYQGEPQALTFTEPLSSYECTFMLEKDVGKMVSLFEEQTSQASSSTRTSQKYMDTMSPHLSYEGSFRSFTVSDECLYPNQSYTSPSPSFHRYATHTAINPYPLSTESHTHPPHSISGVYAHAQQTQTQTFPEALSSDSKANINVNLYQCHQHQHQHHHQQLSQAHSNSHPTTHTHTQSHTHAPMEECSTNGLSRRKTGAEKYTGYRPYPQAFYGASQLHGAEHQCVQALDTSYSVMGRPGSMFHSDLSSGRHLSRRPSLTIPMPTTSPER